MKRSAIVLTALAIPTLALVYPVLLRFFYSDQEQMGLFGDSYGMLNAVFSGLAFIGLIWAIMLQREELSLQREEIRLQRKELEATRLEFEKQSEIFSSQNFESTFFKLIEHGTVERNAVRVSMGSTINQGHDAIKEWRPIVRRYSRARSVQLGVDNMATLEISDFKTIFSQFLAEEGGVFLPVLNLFEQILGYTRTRCPKNQQQFYADLYKGLLSRHELAICFYFVFFRDKPDETKSFVKRVDFFSGLKPEHLIRNEHFNLYGE